MGRGAVWGHARPLRGTWAGPGHEKSNSREGLIFAIKTSCCPVFNIVVLSGSCVCVRTEPMGGAYGSGGGGSGGGGARGRGVNPDVRGRPAAAYRKSLFSVCPSVAHRPISRGITPTPHTARQSCGVGVLTPNVRAGGPAVCGVMGASHGRWERIVRVLGWAVVLLVYAGRSASFAARRAMPGRGRGCRSPLAPHN